MRTKENNVCGRMAGKSNLWRKTTRLLRGWALLALMPIAALGQFGAYTCGTGESVLSDQVLSDGRGVDCGYDDPDWTTKYRTPQHWIPNESTPLKTIAVNIVCFRDDLGQNGWQDTPYIHDRLETLFDSVNYRYSHSKVKGYAMTCEPPITHVEDTKIRFRLNQVYFFNNTTFNQGNNLPDAEDMLDWLWANYPETRGQLNHLMTMPGWPPGTYQGYSPGSPYQGHTYVHSNNLMLEDWPFYINHLCHEYGHIVGLHHVYDSEYKTISHYDFLDDVFGQCAEPLTTDASNPCFANCGQPNQPCPCNPPTGQVCYLTGCNYFQWVPTPHPFMASGPIMYYISPKSAGRMHRALSIYDYAFRLNNRPSQQYVDEKYSYALPYELTADETWDFAMKMYQDLVIPTGVTLTIKCELRMPIAGRIIVKPGAKLIVDGGVITCAHTGYFWQGIQAWGNSAQHQYGNPIPTHQAMVILKNGGFVEHALLGVQTQNPNDPNSTGGVVQVQGNYNQLGGTFLNCKEAVDFDAYQNFNPNNPAQLRSNRSYFNFCDFIVDDSYRGVDDFVAHVDLWKVDGLRFKGCHWKNLQTTITESHKLGQGIMSLDAQYTVSGACTTIQPCCLPCPEANLIRSSFIGLDHGIDASVSETDRSFLVTGCAFEDNVVGVYSRNVNSFQVLRSNFFGGGRNVTLTGDLDVELEFHRGVFTSGGHGFRIEENRFEKTPGAVNMFAGAWVNNSAQYNDVVYKNTAINCEHGFVGEGTCIDVTSAAYIGLQFLCNTNSNPVGYDIFDKRVLGESDENEHSIRTQQGSQSKPAGNVFTLANPPWDASDFRNNTDWVLNYWHLDQSVPQYPADVTPGWVGRWPTTNNNTCPSNFTTGHVHPFTSGGLLAIKSAFNDAKQAYINTAYAYNALLDGGNTDQLITEVEQSWPEDAWELRNTLIARSPHVSEEVLRAVAERNTLPQAMLLEVLLANPDATKQNGFIKWIEFDAPYPLPTYMIELIVGSWEERTFRTQLESSMGQQHADMSVAANLLISECKSDTTGEVTDSTLVYWQRVPSFGARYSETLVRLQRGEFAQATALINGLEAGYRMTTAQLAERDNALAYIGALSSAHGAGHDVMNLTAAEQAVLRTIAAHGCDRPAQWAQNILCYGYGQCTSPCTGGGATQRSLHGMTVPKAEPADPLSVYPNPANSFATLGYVLDSEVRGAVLVLRSMEGSELKRLPVVTSIGQLLLDTREYAPGTYSVDLLNDGNRIATERLVIKP